MDEPAPPDLIDQSKPHVVATAHPAEPLPDLSHEAVRDLRSELMDDNSFWPLVRVVMDTYSSDGTPHPLYWPRLSWSYELADGFGFSNVEESTARVWIGASGAVRYDDALYDAPERTRTHYGQKVFHLDVIGAMVRELAMVAQYMADDRDSLRWDLQLQVRNISGRYGASYNRSRPDPPKFTPKAYPADRGDHIGSVSAMAAELREAPHEATAALLGDLLRTLGVEGGPFTVPATMPPPTLDE